MLLAAFRLLCVALCTVISVFYTTWRIFYPKLEYLVYLSEITPRIKSRPVMSIPADYLKTSFNYKNILIFQTCIIPCMQFVNLSLSPDLNWIILLVPNPIHFHTLPLLYKRIMLFSSFLCIIRKYFFVFVSCILIDKCLLYTNICTIN